MVALAIAVAMAAEPRQNLKTQHQTLSLKTQHQTPSLKTQHQIPSLKTQRPEQIQAPMPMIGRSCL